jgi:hypothetical protein
MGSGLQLEPGRSGYRLLPRSRPESTHSSANQDDPEPYALKGTETLITRANCPE